MILYTKIGSTALQNYNSHKNRKITNKHHGKNINLNALQEQDHYTWQKQGEQSMNCDKGHSKLWDTLYSVGNLKEEYNTTFAIIFEQFLSFMENVFHCSLQ